MVRFEGGSVREDSLGDQPLVEGVVFHQTAIYELIYLLVIFAVLWWLLHRRPPVAPGTGMGVFCLLYGPLRLGTDFLRINDETVLGLTGAQYLMIGISLASIWILLQVRPATATLRAAEADAEATAEATEPEPEPPATVPSDP